jgi:hypothetical protein
VIMFPCSLCEFPGKIADRGDTRFATFGPKVQTRPNARCPMTKR